MSQIAYLAPDVADAIAAGEVVERPAAVVKELCENSIDARAKSISVSIEGCGLTLVRVADDGTGIAADELELAVARHATSKLRARGDLASIATLGFRGEALASIAAVSELKLTARAQGEELGATIHVSHGRFVSKGVEGRAQGTTVEVRDLFATTPARLKFLRSARTEVQLVVRTVQELALANHTIRFECMVDGRQAFATPGGSVEVCLRAVFGVAADALRFSALGAGAGDGREREAVRAWVSVPSNHRSTRSGIVLVVNGRRVHNTRLVAAVEEPYRGLLPVGRHPFGLVCLDVPSSTVDVNVHPTKREVRFVDEGALFGLVARSAWNALQGVVGHSEAVPSQPGGRSGGTSAAARPGNWKPAYHALHNAITRAYPVMPGTDPGSLRQQERVAVLQPPGNFASSQNPVVLEGDAALHFPDTLGPGVSGANRVGDPAELLGLRPVGQVNSTWLVAEYSGGIALVDPHAAHERILYNRELKRLVEAGTPTTQQLLIPVVVRNTGGVPMEAQQIDLLAAAGYQVDTDDGSSYRCLTCPVGTDPSRIEALLLDVLAPAANPDEERSDHGGKDAMHRIAALIACHTAVRFGDRLALTEQRKLLEDLLGQEVFITCPHGRPTIVSFPDGDLRQAFGRPR